MTRYSMSKDGILRTTVRMDIRLTEEQVHMMQELAVKACHAEPSEWKTVLKLMVHDYLGEEILDRLGEIHEAEDILSAREQIKEF